MLGYLIDNCGVGAQEVDTAGDTLLHHAVRNGRELCALRILTALEARGGVIVHDAIRERNLVRGGNLVVVAVGSVRGCL